MKKYAFLFFLLGVVTMSCSKEKSDNTPASDRLSFKDQAEFNDTYLMLSKMDAEELNAWAANKNHKTLLNSTDLSVADYSDALKTILNEDSEYELGGSIIWFNNGQLYAFAKDKASNLKALKQNPDKSSIIGNIRVQKIDDSKLKSVNIGLGNGDARNQFQFTQQYYQPCGGTRNALSGVRKYVHEIYDESIASNPGPVYYSYLHLRIKMEYQGHNWLGKHVWRAAGEQREIRVNVSGSANMYPSGVGGGFNIPNVSYDCSGDKDFLIMQVTGAYPATPSWTVSMSGTIYQHVKGDNASNAWTNTGTLW
jgi:hypothetical protein